MGVGLFWSYQLTALAVEGTALELDLFGERAPAVVTSDVLHDPTATRMKS